MTMDNRLVFLSLDDTKYFGLFCFTFSFFHFEKIWHPSVGTEAGHVWSRACCSRRKMGFGGDHPRKSAHLVHVHC